MVGWEDFANRWSRQPRLSHRVQTRSYMSRISIFWRQRRPAILTQQERMQVTKVRILIVCSCQSRPNVHLIGVSSEDLQAKFPQICGHPVVVEVIQRAEPQITHNDLQSVNPFAPENVQWKSPGQHADWQTLDIDDIRKYTSDSEVARNRESDWRTERTSWS